MAEHQCGNCGQVLTVDDSASQAALRCPACGQLLHAAPDDAPRLSAAETHALATRFEPDPEALAMPATMPRRGRSWAPTLLLFLVPYALVATVAVGWLLWKQPRSDQHPLEWLLDQQPSDGGPKQIKHDLPLLERQKTSLGKTMKIGEVVELTPTELELSPEKDKLTLTMLVKNTSADLRFNPIPTTFLRPNGYVYLDLGKDRAYSGKLAYRKPIGFFAGLAAMRKRGQAKPFDGVLSPGETMIVTLTTLPRDDAVVKKLPDYRGPILWRIEVRRGLVEIAGKPVSATCVIGIEFDAGIAQRDAFQF